MFKNYKFLIILILILAFSCTLFFTLGVPFFWEDPEIFKYGNFQLTSFLTGLKPNFFKLSYYTRPMTYPLHALVSNIFGYKVERYRFFRAFLYSLLAIVCFLILKRFTSNITAFFGALFYVFVPETWFQVLYQDIGLFSHLALTVGLLIFLNVYQRENNKLANFLNLLLVIFLFDFSIAAKHEGRYGVFLLLCFCFFHYRRAIFKNLWFFLSLLSISFPILGLFTPHRNQPLIVQMEISQKPILLISHFFTRFKEPVSTLGVLLWGLLVISFVTLFIIGLTKKNLFFWLKTRQAEGLIFTFIWFLIALSFHYLIGEWDYAPRDFQKIDYTYLWMPFIIFVFTLAYSAYFFLRKNRIYLFAAVIMIAASFFINANNLNRNRGAWGGYWTGLGNLNDFINKREEHAILLIRPQHFLEWYFFYNSKNKIELTSSYKDPKYIRQLYDSGKYTNIYIAENSPLAFAKDDHIVLEGYAKNTSNCPYDKVKIFLGRLPKNMFFIYKYSAK